MENFKIEKRSSRGDILLCAIETNTQNEYYFVKVPMGDRSYVPTDIGDTDVTGFKKAIEALESDGKLIHNDKNAHQDAIEL